MAFSTGPGQSFGISVFIDPIIEDTGISRTTISVLFAASTGVSALMAAIVSRLSDRYGPRYVLVIIATALGAACFGMSLSSGIVGFFLALAALRALGQGSMYVNANLLAANWFVKNRGKAVAIMSLGFAVSNAIIPPTSRILIDSIGWRESYWVLGSMVWLLVIPATLLMVRNTPEEVGLHPDGSLAAPPGEQLPSETPLGPDKRPIFTSPMFWMLALPLAVPALVATALIFHQVSIFAERGLSTTVAATVFVPLAFASAGGATLGGLVIDRVGPKLLFVTAMTLLGSALVVVQFISSPIEASIYAVLLGASAGLSQLIMGVIWAHFYGRYRLGRVQGSAVMILISGAAIGPLPLALLFDLFGSFSPSIAILLLLPVLAIIMILCARPQRSSYSET